MTTPVQPHALITSISAGMQRAKPKISAFSPSAAMSEIAALSCVGHRGHARFDAVDAQRVELLGDRDLFLAAEDDRRLLLAVAQRDVVNLDVAAEGRSFCRTSGR